MTKTNFEIYLEEQLKNPVVAAEFESFGKQIRNVETLLRYFDDRRVELGLNKTELARKLSIEPSNIRRIFSSKNQNPRFSTFMELANSLNLEVRLVPQETSVATKSIEDSKKNKLLPLI